LPKPIAIRSEKLDYPDAANGRVKALRHVFAWALAEELVNIDPTAGIKKLRTKNPDGFHTWTVEEVQRYEARWPLGSKQRLALALLLYTGTRRSDAVRLGPPMAKQEILHFTEVKNATSRAATPSGRAIKPKHRVIPILPELRAVIDVTIIGEETYLVNAYGKPFQPTSFGNSFRDWCDAAGLKQCSAHGLRKAGATIAAENGATATQLMAIYGWERLEQAELYTRAANRTRVAKDAMHLVVPRPS
jgi:integrase